MLEIFQTERMACVKDLVIVITMMELSLEDGGAALEMELLPHPAFSFFSLSLLPFYSQVQMSFTSIIVYFVLSLEEEDLEV